MIVRLAIRYLYRSLPNQPGSYLNRKLLAQDRQTPELLTVYSTRVQVDSSISQIEILRSFLGPKFETFV